MDAQDPGDAERGRTRTLGGMGAFALLELAGLGWAAVRAIRLRRRSRG
jgi:hypothetical protein